MFCKQCGSELREGSKFCGSCGFQLAGATGNGSTAIVTAVQARPVQQTKTAQSLVSVEMQPPKEVERKKRFGKEEQYCSICNTNPTFKELRDGYICPSCQTKILPLNQRIRNLTIKNIHDQIKERQIIAERRERFIPSDGVDPYFAIDKKHELIEVATGRDCSYYLYLPWTDVISFQLLQDGKVVSRRGVGGALVGGALLGATGAVVGAAAGRKSKEKTTELAVKIVTKNEYYPQLQIDLIGLSTKTGSIRYKNASADAQKILSLLTIVVDSVQAKQSKMAGISPAEEIQRYKALLDDGVISQEEFDAKKRQLLGL